MKTVSRVWFPAVLVVAMSSGLGFMGCHPISGNSQDVQKDLQTDKQGKAEKPTQTSGRRPQPKDLTIEQVIFSPDGKLLLAVDHESNLYLYDVEKRKERWRGQIKRVKTAVFFPDGKLLAFGRGRDLVYQGNDPIEGNPSVMIWDVENHRELFSLSGGNQDPYRLLISSDQRFVVSVGTLGATGPEIYKWDIEKGNLEATIFGPREILETRTAAWQENGKTILILANGNPPLNGMFLAQVDLVARSATKLNGPMPDSGLVQFFPDGKRYAAARYAAAHGSWISINALPEYKEIAKLTLGEGKYGISGIAISPDGKLVLAGEYEGVVKVWTTDPAKLVLTSKVPKGNIAIGAVTFSPDSKLVVIGGGYELPDYQPGNPVLKASILYLLDVASGKVVAALQAPK